MEVNTAVLPLQHLLQLTPLAQTVLVAGQAGQLSNSSKSPIRLRAFFKVKCSEVFTPVITDTGVCCAFNGHVSFVESQYSELVKEMQVIDLPFFLVFIFSHLFDL